MPPTLEFRVRQLRYDLGSGLLFRPGMIILALATLAVVLSVTARGATAWLFPGEPSAAQMVLGTIASSMMTVVSVVYSILLVALSLVSMQFSTRILRRFVRDAVSQTTLGLFIGTFVYCLLMLRVVQATPHPVVPALGVGVGVLLAVASMAWLVFFIHHIAQIIQANFLIDQIAEESEAVIDQVLPARASPQLPPQAPPLPEGWRELPAHPILAPVSGYVQLIDFGALASAASAQGGVCEVLTDIGHFAAAGAPMARLYATQPLADEDLETVRGAFDIGPVRTMQDDAEFGVRQIVDIALKALSPAVNDPSTAVTCIDHLTRLLVRAARRDDAPGRWAPTDSPVARVAREGASFRALVNLAVTQIRQYGRADMAVGLRLLRALETVAGVTDDPARRALLARHGALIESALREHFPAEDCEALDERVARLRAATLTSPRA